ncbi:MAG: hypothetical protein IPK13_02835 [Deltaproteobacteria bacterium]|nr:hypothetical protein [Deltaproteobacteria bacterium]
MTSVPIRIRRALKAYARRTVRLVAAVDFAVFMALAGGFGAVPAEAGEAAPTSNPCLNDPASRALLKDLRPAARAAQVASGRSLAEGLTQQQAGDHRLALAAFTEALRLDRSNALAHIGAAESMLYLGNDFDAMAQHLATALLLLPTSARAHDRYATVLAELGEGQIARRHWQCAIAQRSDFVDARIHLAQYALETDDAKEAESQLREILKTVPTHTQAAVMLANLLQSSGTPLEAGRLIAQVAHHVGRSAALYRRAAELFEQGGDQTTSTRLRHEADRLDPPKEARVMRPLKRRGAKKGRRPKKPKPSPKSRH